MASLIAKLWTRISSRKALISIMLIGLDNSGKTSVLNYLASNSSISRHSSSSNRQKNSQRSVNLYDNDEDLETINKSGSNLMPTAGYNYERFQYAGATLTVLDFSGQSRYRNLWQEFYNSVDGIVFVVDSSDLIRLVVAKDELETMLNNPFFNTLDGNEQSNNFLSLQKQLTISQGKLIQSPLEMNDSVNSSSMFKSITKSSSNQRGGGGDDDKKATVERKCRNKIPILVLANKADLANSVDTEVISKALNLSQLPIDRHPWFIQATSVNLSQGITEGFDWLVGQLSIAT